MKVSENDERVKKKVSEIDGGKKGNAETLTLERGEKKKRKIRDEKKNTRKLKPRI